MMGLERIERTFILWVIDARWPAVSWLDCWACNVHEEGESRASSQQIARRTCSPKYREASCHSGLKKWTGKHELLHRTTTKKLTHRLGERVLPLCSASCYMSVSQRCQSRIIHTTRTEHKKSRLGAGRSVRDHSNQPQLLRTEPKLVRP